LQQLLTLSFGRRATDNQPVGRTLTFGELIPEWSNPDPTRGKLTADQYHALDKKIPAQKAIRYREKNGDYFMPVRFGGDGRRVTENIDELLGFVLDFDSGRTTRQVIESKLMGIAYLAYTSYSHRPADPRWRVFIPYAKPITEKKQHGAVFKHFNALFDADIDENCKKPCQFYYTPACPHDAVDTFESFHQEAELFDPMSIDQPTDSEAPAAPSNEPPAPGGQRIVDLEALKDALTKLDPDPRELWIDTGLAIKHDLGEPGLPIWLAWSKGSSKFDPIEAVKEWQSLNPRSGPDAITCASVFHRAKQAGWKPKLADGVPQEIAEVNEQYFLAPYGRKVPIFRKSVDPLDSHTRFEPMDLSQFRVLLANRKISGVGLDGRVRTTPLADHWLQHPHRREYHGVVFAPGTTISTHFNLWQGFAVEPKQGSWEQMRRHLLFVVCGGKRKHYRYLLDWMAYAVQKPGKQGEVAVVLRGGQGAGKGVVARSLGKLFGPHFAQISQPAHLTGHFNGHLESCLLLFVDEGYWAGDRAGEGVLKGLVTEPTIQIERKGFDSFPAKNCLHIIIASNNDWVVPAGPDERRYFVLDVDEARKQDPTYFAPIYAEMDGGGPAAMLHYLLHRDISRFNIRAVPQTEALGEQKLQSLSPTDRWWFDKLVAGHFEEGEHLSRVIYPWGQVPTAVVHADYVKTLNKSGINRKSTATEVGKRLTRLLPPSGAAPHKARVMVNGMQEYVYNLPPLADCRAHFEKFMKLDGRIDWATGGVIG
jgi:hypothetical protein